MKASASFPIAPKVAQFARINVPSSCLTHRARVCLPGSDCRLTRMSMEINCRNRLTPPDGRGHSGGNERKQKVVTISLQPSFPVLAMLGLKNQRKTMQIKNDVAESDALTIGKSASALGVHEFSLFSRIQALPCPRPARTSTGLSIPKAQPPPTYS
jgi:hypothetical protein